jgi:hypothetical protein
MRAHHDLGEAHTRERHAERPVAEGPFGQQPPAGSFYFGSFLLQLQRLSDRGRDKDRDTDYVVGTDKHTRTDVIPDPHYTVDTLLPTT